MIVPCMIATLVNDLVSLGVIFRWIKIVILCLSWALWSWWPPPGHPCHRVNTMEQTEFGPSGAAEAALNMMEGRLCQAKMPPDSEAEKLWIFSVLCEAGSVLTTGPACDNVTSCAALSWIRTFAKFNNYGKGPYQVECVKLECWQKGHKGWAGWLA